MPIKDKSLYPDNWREISHRIRFERAKGQCEAVENGQRCQARHGKTNPLTFSKVVLTTAHLDHDTTNNAPSNLMAMCQRHHLTYDAALHAKHARETRRQKQVDAGQLSVAIPWHCSDCGATWEASLAEFPDKAHCPECQSVHIY